MLNLADDSVADHVRKMAVHFNAKLDEGNDASTITMDNEQAKGFISSYRIFSGLSVWVYNVKFGSDYKIDLGLFDARPYYFSYNVQGHYLHRFGDEKDFSKILQNQNLIVRGSPETFEEIVFPANVELKIAVIRVDLKLVGNLHIRNARRIFLNMEKVFQGFPSHRHYRHLGGINTETEKHASIVCKNKDVDLVGGLRTEAAVFSMLASQIHAYRENISINESSLSKSELSKLTSLASFVRNNLEASLTIPILSRHFGISPKKLQVGVNYLYGDSVGRYILSLRMDHAKHLLNTTDLNVTEVCARVGISSRGYFSKVFKNKYGKSPSHFLV
jgi:AraC-like DNA-binding protein